MNGDLLALQRLGQAADELITFLVDYIAVFSALLLRYLKGPRCGELHMLLRDRRLANQRLVEVLPALGRSARIELESRARSAVHVDGRGSGHGDGVFRAQRRAKILLNEQPAVNLT